MNQEPKESFYYPEPERKPEPEVFVPPKKNSPNRKTILKHLGLFVLTFISVSTVSTILVGLPSETAFWGFIPTSEEGFLRGILFATLLLTFLTFHEFGHYFAAVYHKVEVSLPYYIPLPVGIGTLGAVIRIKEQIHETKKLFDIGAAGPIAGFIVSLIVLFIGFATLPGVEYLNEFGDHNYVVEYYNQTGEYPEEPQIEEGTSVFFFGGTPLYNFLSSLFEGAPPLWEIQHYPFLIAGWFGLFFTALNLMPVGQLDGGHILYSLIGYKKHKIVARLFFSAITILAGIEAIPLLHDYLVTKSWDNDFGVLSWLIWIGVLFLIMQKAFYREQYWVASMLPTSLIGSAFYLYVIRANSDPESSLIWVFWTFFIAFVVKVEHPPVLIEKPLTPTRKVIGWLSMLIFVLCISLNPLSFKTFGP
ncbi:MAG: site-2 protease family protein [Balneolaceae bacterium]|nr:site-2 protease family protein [Balneolaceae bacterium]MBO6545391.1 site-2 protease family protein [Balneolaceae bacterium]MBO6646787.1 site-2 protease family protein [Balneolaceae bacterium]